MSEYQKEKIERIANNALYFDDSSDFREALWKILEITSSHFFDETTEPKLEYIHD